MNEDMITPGRRFCVRLSAATERKKTATRSVKVVSLFPPRNVVKRFSYRAGDSEGRQRAIAKALAYAKEREGSHR